MIAVLAILGLGDAAWLAHFITTHRTGLTAALTSAAAWAGAHSRIPLLAPHMGAHTRRRTA